MSLPGVPNGTYDPQKVIFIFNGVQYTGFAKGSFIVAKRAEPTFKPEVGSSGEESWTKSASRIGTVEVKMMSTSQDNASLAADYQADELDNSGLAPLEIKDLNGNMLCHAAFARITKPADMERAQEQGETPWEFASTNLDIINGGLNGT
jgi:Protein of unknown function (DUF3277)